MARLKITAAMRVAASTLLRAGERRLNGADCARLTGIIGGKRKVIDAAWWAKIHRVVDQGKLDKLAALADPVRNPNEHERRTAGRKLAEFQGRTPPGSRPQAPPLPDDISQWKRKPSKRGGVNTAESNNVALILNVEETSPASSDDCGVNTKPSRTADRHLARGDRHSPGYMRDYMRRRRANEGAQRSPSPQDGQAGIGLPQFLADSMIEQDRRTATYETLMANSPKNKKPTR
jgi:hypothetical protein